MRQNILGITTTALGDTLLNIPAINTIGRTHDLDIVVHSRNSDLFDNNKWIRNIVTYRNNPICRRFVSLRLRNTIYDGVVILHANSDILKLLKLIRYRKAYSVQPWNIPDLNLYQIYYDPSEHHIDKRMRLAYALGVKRTSEPMVVELTEEETAFSSHWLGDRKVKSPYLCVCPGASLPYRRWPIELFSSLISKFVSLHPNFGVVVIGSKAETNLYKSIARHCSTVTPAIGLGLRQLASILHGSRLLVTNDTGPMHLGQAVGTRVLALFGPSDPITIGPRGPMHKVIATTNTCKPCATKKCKEPVCMADIAVENVLCAMESMISASA